MQIAKDNDLKSIAFPAISTAIFGYNINDATPVALHAVKDFVINNPKAFDEIRFVVFSYEDFTVYQKCMNELLNASINDLKYSKFYFFEKALNVVVWGGLGTVSSIMSCFSIYALFFLPDSHYSIAYGVAIAPFAAMACWVAVAENLSKFIKARKENLSKPCNK